MKLTYVTEASSKARWALAGVLQTIVGICGADCSISTLVVLTAIHVYLKKKRIITILVFSYTAPIPATQWRSRCFKHTIFFPARYLGLHLTIKAQCNGLQGCCDTICCQSNQEHWGKPLLFSIRALVSFTRVTQHTGPTALRPIQRTKQ